MKLKFRLKFERRNGSNSTPGSDISYFNLRKTCDGKDLLRFCALCHEHDDFKINASVKSRLAILLPRNITVASKSKGNIRLYSDTVMELILATDLSF